MRTDSQPLVLDFKRCKVASEKLEPYGRCCGFRDRNWSSNLCSAPLPSFRVFDTDYEHTAISERCPVAGRFLSQGDFNNPLHKKTGLDRTHDRLLLSAK